MKKRFTVRASRGMPHRHRAITAASRPEDTLQELINMIPNMRSMLDNIADYAKSLIATGIQHPQYFGMMDMLYENLNKIQDHVGPANFALGYAQHERTVQGSIRPVTEYRSKLSKEIPEKVPYIESLLDELEGNLNKLSADFGAHPSDASTVNHIAGLLTEANRIIITTNFMVDEDRHDHGAIMLTRKIRRSRIVASQVWDDPNYDLATGMYLPSSGEGDTFATQVVTAVNKLVYKWYNDGDVYDNNYGLEGFANDLSSYANWLYEYVPGADTILDGIYDAVNESQYERILDQLVKSCLDGEDLENWNNQPKQGTIYNCAGPFSFNDDPYGESEEDW